MRKIEPIRSDPAHKAALKEVDLLWGAESGTPDGDRLDTLVALIEAYETERYPIAKSD
jgi:HTH-type transcriptional regulator/antitoxin HigA